MDDILRAAIAPILRDLRTADVGPARFDDEDWARDPGCVSVTVWSADGSGTGIYVSRSAAKHEQVVALADQMQGWAIEERWGGGSTTWPECPRHPNGHPLEPAVSGGRARWVCPSDRTEIVDIGSL